MTTVQDVARLAGVSPATVSRVLNGRDSVRPPLRARVREAIDELGFRPDPLARGLRKRQTNTVVLLVGDIAQAHLLELTLGLQTELEQSALDLMLYNLGHSEQRLLSALERGTRAHWRGVILALSDDLPEAARPRFDALRARGVAIVAIGQDLTRFGVASIVHEESAAARRSVAYLLSKGHRRIAYAGRIRGSAVGSARFSGYREALEEAGVFDEALVWDLAFRYAAGHQAVQSALDAGERFTALQAGSDEIAMGAIGALVDRGLTAGVDVDVIGFGNVQVGAYMRPPLTTLSSHSDLAARAARQLLDDEALRDPSPLTVLTRTLIRRSSA